LPYFAIFVLISYIDLTAGTYYDELEVGLLSLLFALAALYPWIAIGIKRCHDRNRTGWFLLIGLIPLVSIWLVVELSILRGSVGPNRFGPDPLAGSGTSAARISGEP
jgi:uncharacterized membrane protein YhaH (DUF805 family)